MSPPSRSSRARAVDAPPDLALARRLLSQAERHLKSAAIHGVDVDSRFGMLYDAARKSADAVIRAEGRRVTQGTGHHIVFLAEARRLLPCDNASVFTRVEAARSIRNAMEYRAREVTRTEVAELSDAAADLLVSARAFVEGKAGS